MYAVYEIEAGNRDRLKTGRSMIRHYVESRDGSFYLIGSRVPLAIIVQDFRDGDTPESIQSNFPELSLEQIYGAITFYLSNKDEVEKDMAERRRVEVEFVREHPNPSGLRRRLLQQREQMLTRPS